MAIAIGKHKEPVGGSSASFSHVCTGTDRVLVFYTKPHEAITKITYKDVTIQKMLKATCNCN